jgi:Ubiquitin carboxyl-terminal hydrolase
MLLNTVCFVLPVIAPFFEGVIDEWDPLDDLMGADGVEDVYGDSNWLLDPIDIDEPSTQAQRDDAHALPLSTSSLLDSLFDPVIAEYSTVPPAPTRLTRSEWTDFSIPKVREWSRLGFVNSAADERSRYLFKLPNVTLNNCFFNSVMQVLMRLDRFRDLPAASADDAPILTHLRDFMAANYPTPAADAVPATLRNTILPIDRFPLGIQSDAAETLDFILDELVGTPVAAAANFQAQLTDTCANCGHPVAKTEPFSALGVYFPSKIASHEIGMLEQMVNGGMVREQVDGYRCSDQRPGESAERGCLGVHQSVRTTDVVTPPEVLVLQIRRFASSTTIAKDGTKVYSERKIGNALVLPLSGLTVAGRKYRLHGVVHHNGDSTTEGHYTADVFDTKVQSWINYNDAAVVPSEDAADETLSFVIDGNVVYSSDASLLVYVAEDVTAFPEASPPLTAAVGSAGHYWD